jgi:hypothetical protein
MKLLRRGSRADHGAAVMFDKSNSKIEWHQTSKTVRLSVLNVRDVDQKRVTYNYSLYVSVDDVKQIVGALADGLK